MARGTEQVISKRSIGLYIVAVLLTVGAVRLEPTATELCPSDVDPTTDSMLAGQPHLLRVAQGTAPPPTIDCSDDSQLVELCFRYGAILLWGCALASTVADVQQYRKRKKAKRRRRRRPEETAGGPVDMASGNTESTSARE